SLVITLIFFIQCYADLLDLHSFPTRRSSDLNLHAAVKEVASKYNGIVPSNLKDLGDLKGIGPYTKGAIASIAFNKPEPAVDGNVMRVLSRVLLITENISEAKTKKMFEN